MALPPCWLIRLTMLFVYLPAENHLHHVHGLAVGDPHAVDEVAFDVQPLEQVADLRTTTVHHHRIHADRLQQYHITSKTLFELLISHRVTAVFDYQRLAGEAADIRKCLTKDTGIIHRSFDIQTHLNSS